MYVNSKYKDSSPLQTIARIRNILEGIGILTRERWRHDIEGYYSVNVEILGTGLSSNGKGASEEFALASGYAELMERLQNFRMNGMMLDASPKAFEYKGFYFTPDERYTDPDDAVENDEEWIHILVSRLCTKDEKVVRLKEWLFNNIPGIADKIILIPYLRINDGKVCSLPEVMIKACYGTNGMCAGNTHEEALVQGLSEIMERYANIEILRRGLIPPDIPREYIKKYPHIDEMISSIEQKGNYKIIVKDCSLGEKLPVVGVVLIDRILQKYRAQMGAHPVFEIAVERCLTELLQGKKLDNKWWMTDFSYFNNVVSERNINSIFTTGKGIYPARFFSSNYSYQYTEPLDLRHLSNKDMFSYLVDILVKKNLYIYIRNVSFLGFPSFHVIVPSFSEISSLESRTVRRVKSLIRINQITRNLYLVSDEELEELISFMYDRDIASNTSIIGLMGLPLKKTFPWNNMMKDLLVFCSYYRLNEFRKAYSAMECFIRDRTCNQDGNINDAAISYYKCIRDYTGLRSDGVTDRDSIKSVLCKFYSEKLVEKVIIDMGNPLEVFRNCVGVKCYQCDECDFSTYCNYPEIMKLHMKLKDKYAENTITQGKILI